MLSLTWEIMGVILFQWKPAMTSLVPAHLKPSYLQVHTYYNNIMWPSTRKPCKHNALDISHRYSPKQLPNVIIHCLVEESFLYTKICFVASSRMILTELWLKEVSHLTKLHWSSMMISWYHKWRWLPFKKTPYSHSSLGSIWKEMFVLQPCVAHSL